MNASPQDEVKRKLLQSCRTIAVVGISADPNRPGNYVPRYLQEQGYRIVPVNPYLTEALGEKAYPDLHSIPFPVDVVDVFRRSEAVHDVVKAAQEIGVPAVWMQPRIECSEDTEQFAREHHMLLIKDA
jgi:uncharacterized protein